MRLREHGAEVGTVTWSSNGLCVAAGTGAGDPDNYIEEETGAIDTWNVKTKDCVSFDAYDKVYGVSWSPDNNYLASSSNLSIRIQDMRMEGNGREYYLDGKSNTFMALSWSPDRR